MRYLWTLGVGAIQDLNNFKQTVRIAIEQEVKTDIGGPHDFWFHEDDYKNKEKEIQSLKQLITEARSWVGSNSIKEPNKQEEWLRKTEHINV